MVSSVTADLIAIALTESITSASDMSGALTAMFIYKIYEDNPAMDDGEHLFSLTALSGISTPGDR